MNGTHATGGTAGLLLGYLSARYGWGVSQDEAFGFGAGLAAVGGLIAHVVTGPGIIPAVKRAIFGPPAPPAAQ